MLFYELLRLLNQQCLQAIDFVPVSRGSSILCLNLVEQTFNTCLLDPYVRWRNCKVVMFHFRYLSITAKR